jgi:hypothetical protein
MRTALSVKLLANNQPVPEPSTPTEALLKPSIFDSDHIKELRVVLQDMVEKLQETRE